MLEKLGKWLDYWGYLLKSNNRHGTHSPFVYTFADQVLYAKTSKINESIEFQRTQMIQSKGIFQEFTLSYFVDNYTLSSKFGRLLSRICSFYSIGNIHEFGWCTGIETNYLLESFLESPRPFSYKYFNQEKNQIKEKCNQDFWENHDFSAVEVVENLDSQPSLFFFHWSIFNEDAFWTQLERVFIHIKNDDIIVVNGLRNNENTIINFMRLKNDPRITVSIDLFEMGLFFVRKEQPKQDFMLRF